MHVNVLTKECYMDFILVKSVRHQKLGFNGGVTLYVLFVPSKMIVVDWKLTAVCDQQPWSISALAQVCGLFITKPLLKQIS